MIFGSFLSSGAWGWIALAAVLLVAEIAAPGNFLIWLGGAALATGILFLAIPAAWQIQLAVFALLAVVSVFGWFHFVKGRRPAPTDRPTLNRRPEALIGREFVLDEPLSAGRGRIRFADTVWAVTGPDCASGTRVRVVRLDGATLVVEPA
jgi:inner membrane protein